MDSEEAHDGVVILFSDTCFLVPPCTKEAALQWGADHGRSEKIAWDTAGPELSFIFWQIWDVRGLKSISQAHPVTMVYVDKMYPIDI